MLVCDSCKAVNKKAFDVSIRVIKHDVKPKKVVTIPIQLCDDCITKMCQRLGKLKSEDRLTT